MSLKPGILCVDTPGLDLWSRSLSCCPDHRGTGANRHRHVFFTRLWIPGPGGVISGTTISDYFLNSLVMLLVHSHPPDYFNVWKGLKLSEKMEILLLVPSWLIYTEVHILFNYKCCFTFEINGPKAAA